MRSNWLTKIFTLEKDPRAVKLAKLLQHVPGSLHRNFFGVSFNGVYQGMKFRASFWGAEKEGNPQAYPCLEIVIFKPSIFKMQAYKFRDSPLIKLLVWLRIIRKIKTGYEEIDNDLCILSRHINEVRTYLSDPKKRQALIELFNKRFTSVEIKKNSTRFIKLLCSLNDIEPEGILPILENFVY